MSVTCHSHPALSRAALVSSTSARSRSRSFLPNICSRCAHSLPLLLFVHASSSRLVFFFVLSSASNSAFFCSLFFFGFFSFFDFFPSPFRSFFQNTPSLLLLCSRSLCSFTNRRAIRTHSGTPWSMLWSSLT